jgi:hypothetical protein
MLFAWAIRHDIKRRRQGLKANRLWRRIESTGLLLIYTSLFFPAAYQLLRLPVTEALRLSLLILFFGLLLLALMIADIYLNIVQKMLLLITRSPLTRGTRIITRGITLFGVVTGGFLTVAGIGFLLYIWLEKMRP